MCFWHTVPQQISRRALRSFLGNPMGPLEIPYSIIFFYPIGNPDITKLQRGMGNTMGLAIFYPIGDSQESGYYFRSADVPKLLMKLPYSLCPGDLRGACQGPSGGPTLIQGPLSNSPIAIMVWYVEKFIVIQLTCAEIFVAQDLLLVLLLCSWDPQTCAIKRKCRYIIKHKIQFR